MRERISTLKRSVIDAGLAIRGHFVRPELNNLFVAQVQKTGSQWFKAVLHDPRVRAKTGLMGVPQRRYEYTEFKKKASVEF